MTRTEIIINVIHPACVVTFNWQLPEALLLKWAKIPVSLCKCVLALKSKKWLTDFLCSILLSCFKCHNAIKFHSTWRWCFLCVRHQPVSSHFGSFNKNFSFKDVSLKNLFSSFLRWAYINCLYHYFYIFIQRHEITIYYNRMLRCDDGISFNGAIA